MDITDHILQMQSHKSPAALECNLLPWLLPKIEYNSTITVELFVYTRLILSFIKIDW